MSGHELLPCVYGSVCRARIRTVCLLVVQEVHVVTYSCCRLLFHDHVWACFLVLRWHV